MHFKFPALRYLFWQLVVAGLLVPKAYSQIPRLRLDTTRIWRTLAQIQYTSYEDTARVGPIIRQVLAETQRAEYIKGEAIAYHHLGLLKSKQGQHIDALRALRRAEQLMLRLMHTQPSRWLTIHLSQVINAIASDEHDLGNISASTAAYLRAIKYAGEVYDYDDLVLMYSDLAGNFADVEQPVQSLSYLHRATALRKQPLSQPEHLLIPYIQLAMMLIEHHSIQKARESLLQARRLLVLPRAGRYRANYERTLGIYFFEIGRYRQAQACFRRALAIVKQTGNTGRVADLYFALGRAASACGNTVSAHAQLVHCVTLARGAHNRILEAQVLEQLAALEESRGPSHAPTALNYLKQFQVAQAQLGGEETKRTILGLETRYRTREQQQQIKALHLQQQIQQQALHRKTLLSYAALIIAGLLLCAIVLFYRINAMNKQLVTEQLLLQASRVKELEGERQRVATEAMLHGQDEERGRIARDLHDSLGGMLTAAKHYLSAGLTSVVLPTSSTRLFTHSLQQLDTSIRELHRVANNLMPEALQRFGLGSALQDLCAALNHDQQLQVQFQTYGLPDRLPQRLEIVIYRLVQELVNNAMKHAGAQTILVQLLRSSSILQLTVEDDGRGFTPTNARSGIGLRSIQSRVDYLRGTIDWHSQLGQGTTATIEFPLTDA